MNTSHQKSHAHIASSFSITAFLAAVVLAPSAQAVSKKTKPAKPAPANSAPVDLGNNILLLGEDSAPPAKQLQTGLSIAKKPAVALVGNTNAHLVAFCRSYLGRKLGNGQCSELAMLGLPAVGAQMDLNNQWGTPVCNYGAAGGRQFIQLGAAGRNTRNPHIPDVRPGDIIQYENVKFEQHWSNGAYAYQSYPHHTSIIEQVSRDGQTYKVLEQNVNNTQIVLETTLHLPDLTEGTMHISRPIPYR